MEVTNKDILKFFADKHIEKKFSYPEEYMQTHKLTGPYIERFPDMRLKNYGQRKASDGSVKEKIIYAARE